MRSAASAGTPTGPAAGRLRLAGTVAFSVDGAGGSTAGTASGDGAVLRVRADDPVAAWAAVARSAPAGADSLGRLADRLHAEGLAVEVSGPDGVLATVGAGADSALGRAVTGSRRVQPGRPAALRPFVVAQLRAAGTAQLRAAGTAQLRTAMTAQLRGAARSREGALLLAALAALALAVRRHRDAH